MWDQQRVQEPGSIPVGGADRGIVTQTPLDCDPDLVAKARLRIACLVATSLSRLLGDGTKSRMEPEVYTPSAYHVQHAIHKRQAKLGRVE